MKERGEEREGKGEGGGEKRERVREGGEVRNKERRVIGAETGEGDKETRKRRSEKGKGNTD